MEQTGNLSQDQLEVLKLVKTFLENREDEAYDGSLSQAKRLADKFTEQTAIKAMVIRRKNRYDWVSEYFFDTYEYNGKIYYETEVNLD